MMAFCMTPLPCIIGDSRSLPCALGRCIATGVARPNQPLLSFIVVPRVMPQKPKHPPVTVENLAYPPRDVLDRFALFERYSKQKPTPDAIAVLRRALADPFHGTVKCAAHSLRKLGPAAREA